VLVRERLDGEVIRASRQTGGRRIGDEQRSMRAARSGVLEHLGREIDAVY
jgi:hypothetical protein